MDIPVATTSARIDSLSFAVDVSGLEKGFNTLFVRALDGNGKWTHTYMRPFYKADLTLDPDTADIVKAEYFLNSDPGFGNGVDIPVATATGRIDSLSFSADVSGLEKGFNMLFVRALDGNGKWTHTHMRPFYKADLTLDPDTADIVKAEYFLNSDPGFGSGVDIPVATTSGRIDSLSFTADVGGLQNGMNTLFVRALDENGKWSFTCTEEFCHLPYASFTSDEVVYGNPTSFTLLSEQAGENIVYNWDVDTDGAFDYFGEDDFQHLYGSAGGFMVRLVFGIQDECFDTIEKEVLVNPAELTIGGSFNVEEKKYDGTNTATIAENNLNLTGIIGEDDVNIGDVEVEFTQSTPGASIIANIISAELTGTDSDNYSLSLDGAPTSTSNIYLYGDANCDGLVNVLDLTTLVNYFTGRDTESFFFKNADVNYDELINVLDFIGTVRIFLGIKSFKAVSLQPEPVHLYLNHDGISLKSNGALSGLQFELTGTDLNNLTLNPGLEHHKLVYNLTDERITGMILSMDNTPVPAGEKKLVSFNNEEVKVAWGDVVAGNVEGENIPVIKHEFVAANVTFPGEESGFAASPNPASDLLWVEFMNKESAPARVSLLNIHGQVVKMRIIPRKGYSKVMFNLKDLYSGIYILRLEQGDFIVNSKIIVKQD